MGNTISVLNYQLGKIENLIKADLKNDTIVYNYFINENSEKLLDLNSLIDFLSQTEINKTLFLETIVKKCKRIIDYWNNDLPGLKEKEAYYSYYNESTGVFINSQSEFHCIVLKPYEWQFFYTESEFNYFFDNYDYKSYTIEQIANRCSIIANWITANYPETIPEEQASTPPNNEPPKKIITKDNVITFILDCFANNIDLPIGKQTHTQQRISKGLIAKKYKGNPNTFFKEFRKITDKRIYKPEHFTDSFLIDSIGENWQDIVLYLSDNPDKLKQYIKASY